jgi:hypothetical protein
MSATPFATPIFDSIALFKIVIRRAGGRKMSWWVVFAIARLWYSRFFAQPVRLNYTAFWAVPCCTYTREQVSATVSYSLETAIWYCSGREMVVVAIA